MSVTRAGSTDPWRLGLVGHLDVGEALAAPCGVGEPREGEQTAPLHRRDVRPRRVPRGGLHLHAAATRVSVRQAAGQRLHRASGNSGNNQDFFLFILGTTHSTHPTAPYPQNLYTSKSYGIAPFSPHPHPHPHPHPPQFSTFDTAVWSCSIEPPPQSSASDIDRCPAYPVSRGRPIGGRISHNGEKRGTISVTYVRPVGRSDGRYVNY